MRIRIFETWSQITLTPYIRITYSRELNGDLELIFGWIMHEISISI